MSIRSSKALLDLPIRSPHPLTLFFSLSLRIAQVSQEAVGFDCPDSSG